MKITKSQLRKLIKEEIDAVVSENEEDRRGPLQKLSSMDHEGYSSRADIDEPDLTDRERMASVLANTRYIIDDETIAALLAIIVAKARKRDQYGPEEMDIYGKVTNDN
tara:strand:- start:6761 stop:7084 length:324 start_codon:yes stop_codon:yes gene_type:complete